MPTVFFYISGHGFGHAVRQIAIVNALRVLAGDGIRVCIRTSAPAWLFERSVAGPFELLPGETDTGVVQVDSLRLDEAATIDAAAAFYATLTRDGQRLSASGGRARLDAEVEQLERHHARLVIADAPPLACAAANAAGIPAVVCANFTWDWIYREYATPSTPGVTAEIQDMYRSAEAAWRLPMHGGFDGIGRIVDVPLVARHARQDWTRDELRRALGIPPDRPAALVSFGGYGVRNLPIDRLDCTRAWTVVLTGTAAEIPAPPTGVAGIDERVLYERGFRYEDVVRAVDVVVTKPGYGIISDCIANGAAMLYTSRGRFAEYDVLVREMPRFLRTRFIPVDDLLAGRWREGLDALLAAPAPPETPAADGARVVADMIVRRLAD